MALYTGECQRLCKGHTVMAGCIFDDSNGGNDL